MENRSLTMDVLFQSHAYKAVSGTATAGEVRKRRRKKPQTKTVTQETQKETLHENGSEAACLEAKHTDRKLSKFNPAPAM